MKNFITKFIKSKRARARFLPWAKNSLVLTLIGVNLWAFAPNEVPVIAVTVAPVEGPVAAVAADVTYSEVDPRALKLARYLESKNSILANYAVDFVAAADKYSIDWRLLPAIAGDESGFAKAYVRGTYNAWGWGGGYINLGSWPEAIETISKAIRENYLDKWGAKNVDEIGRIYAADPYWATKVKAYIAQIEKFN